METWADYPMIAFDIETTGVDVENDRIVQAAVAYTTLPEVLTDGSSECQWLIDPGIEIPESATAVHGITTERARAEGSSPEQALRGIRSHLQAGIQRGWPIVGMNFSFDLTILDRELRRYGVEQIDFTRVPCTDVYVIDKEIDRYRRGSRKLDALCAHYRVELDSAHEALSDAKAAARVAWRIAKTRPDIGATRLIDLHELQIQWAKRQADSLRRYFERQGETEKAASVCGDWPLRSENAA